MLIRQLKSNRAQSAAAIRDNALGRYAVGSAATVQRLLRRKGYRKYLMDVVPHLTYIQQLHRRKFAHEYRAYNWDKVLFTDEKRFSKIADGPLQVWRLAGEARNPACTRKRKKHGGGGIMVWGAISRRHTYPLIRIDGNLDAAQYISQVLNKITPKLPRPTSKRLVFMHDGAHAHTAAIVKRWMSDHGVATFEAWPANSPDANPIEHVWAYLEKRLQERH